jgi:hypothetical protein
MDVWKDKMDRPMEGQINGQTDGVKHRQIKIGMDK